MENKDLVIKGLDCQTIYDVSSMLIYGNRATMEMLKGINASEETKHEFAKKVKSTLAFNDQLISYLEENKPSAES